MISYVSHVNGLIRDTVSAHGRVVVFGQNITAGSCLSGLTRGLKSEGNRLAINTPNMENTLVGTGFGLMMSGVPAIFFMKQQDFLLLGVDHLVNTYNLIRRRSGVSSFTIVPIVVDSGFEGPQSASNNLADLCSLARIDGFAISNAHDAELIVPQYLISPGFRIISVSQRLFKREIAHWDGPVWHSNDHHVIRYAVGEDLTIVSLNFAFEQGVELYRAATAIGVGASLFSDCSLGDTDWAPVLDNAEHSGRLVILDDSKSVRGPGHSLALAAHRIRPIPQIITVSRCLDNASLRPQSDRFEIDAQGILDSLEIGPRRVSLVGA